MMGDVPQIKARYDDITISGRIVDLLRTLNEAIRMDNGVMGLADFEIACLGFILNFRSCILGDPKLIMLG